MKALAIFLFFGWVTAALADQNADIIKSFGLIGTFADNCSVPLSQQGRTNIWAIGPDGRVTTQIFIGGVVNGVNTVVQVEHLSDTSIKLISQVPAGTVETILAKVGNGYRNMSARLNGGQQLVENGILLQSGASMPIMQQCQTEASAIRRLVRTRNWHKSLRVDKAQDYPVQVRGTCNEGAATLCSSVANSPSIGKIIWLDASVPDWHVLDNDSVVLQVLNKMRSTGFAYCASRNPRVDVVSGVIYSANGFGQIISACWADGQWHIQSRVAQLKQQEAAAMAEKEQQKKEEETRKAAADAKEKQKQVALADCGPSPKLISGPWFSSTYNVGGK